MSSNDCYYRPKMAMVVGTTVLHMKHLIETRPFLVRLVSLLSFVLVYYPSSTYAGFVGPFPDGVPGSGYGCDNPCDGGDVNYVVEARLETYTIANSANAGYTTNSKKDMKVLTRTFVGHTNTSSPFCYNGQDGTEGPIGPCLTVNPGQQMKIKIINSLDNAMEILQQTGNTVDDYWQLASAPGNPGLDGIQFFGKAPDSPEKMQIINSQDIPGMDVNYDVINLHVHGMQVVPHLFYPLGTGNASADWITITPASQNPDTKCFCYIFDVPDDHPTGTYWYHIHRHGAAAMQAWQGVIGYLLVGNTTTSTSPDSELKKQGITRDEPLALWEWKVDEAKTIDDNTTYIEPNFLDGDSVFLTNNEYQPNVTMCTNETVHFRLLCAQTITGSILYIMDEENNTVPFWVFASDGISYRHPVEKQAIVVGPGQREGLLVQFQNPGQYTMMQIIVNDFQDNIDLTTSTPAMTFVVSNSSKCKTSDAIDIAALEFTPGVPDNVSTADIGRQVDITFMVQSDLSRAPIPQFVIDGQLFDFKRSVDTVAANTSQQWTLTSNMNYFHPFHIHLNPFQVISTEISNVKGTLAGTNISFSDIVYSTSMEPAGMWRDTVFIPPFGQTIIYQRFGEVNAFAGKTVYHCHFMDHEDQGMIAAFVIDNPLLYNNSESNQNASTENDSATTSSGHHLVVNTIGSILISILIMLA